MQIHNAAITGSFTYNGSDISNVSSSNAYSASFSTRVTNTESTGSSLTTASGSFSTRTTNLESTGSSLTTASGSFSTRVTNTESTGSSLTTASGSFSTRISSIEGNYATTGSNVFMGAQTICANITSTGTIVAQTINVQQVTSSIVYSSGSNIFGNLSSDVQQMTGSLRITGSLNTIGNACVTSICSPTFVGGTVSGTTVYASTVACSPVGCFTTSCASAFVGGTVSGTTIYGSTAICGAVICGGATTLTGALSGTSATFSGNLNLQGAVTRNINFYDSSNTNINAQIQYDQISSNSGQLFFGTNNAGTFATRLTIANTGIACFSSNVCVGGNLVVNGSTIELNCSNTTNTDTRINFYTKNAVNGDRASIYTYNLSATTAGCELTYLAFGYCCTNNQGYINMQTKSGGAWCDTMYVRNGLVGIGTNAPGAKLQVNGTIISTGLGIGSAPLTELYINSGTIRVDGSTPLMYLRGGSTGAKGAITLNHFGYVDFSINAGCSGNYILGITKTPGGTDGILLHCSGNVGIGMNNPTSNLEIQNSSNVEVRAHTTSTSQYSNFITDTDNGVNYRGQLVSFGSTASSTLLGNNRAGGTFLVKSGGLLGVGTRDSQPLVFGTNEIERMRITSGGSVNITSGISGPRFFSYCDNMCNLNGLGLDMAGCSYEFGLFFAYGTSDNGRISFGSYQQTCYRSKMIILGNGNIGVPGNATAIYNASDCRLKNNVEPLNYGLAQVMCINPVKFNWKCEFLGDECARNNFGFIAQQVQSVLPDLVEQFGGSEVILSDGTVVDIPLRINEKNLTALLVKAIQEQQCKINILESCLGLT